ncbi:hypothetical protein F5Y02DRAFT_429252 [Annulohypoxylon stygium]|nr:hypothetical protein F5Y02DRAFT_429252 [Annulohypoxylon stygium]
MASQDTTSTPVPPWDYSRFEKDSLSAEDLKVATAYEKFGEMLSICDETCQQVEQTVGTFNREIDLAIFGVAIGFSDADAMRYFINTKGGLKFVALVCALVTAFGSRECAEILAQSMKHYLSRAKKQYPTAEELLPLIRSIHDRCQLSGFADRIVNYEIKFIHHLLDLGATCPSRLGKTPAMALVIKIISMLQDLQADHADEFGFQLKAFEIRAGICALWIAAMLNWWSGKEATTYIIDRQSKKNVKLGPLHLGNVMTFVNLEIVIDQSSPPYARVLEFYPSMTKDLDSIDGIGKAEQYGGLVTISSYFRLMLCAFRLDRGEGEKAILEALPFVLAAAQSSLAVCSGACVTHDRWGSPCFHDLKRDRTQKGLRQQPGRQPDQQEQRSPRSDDPSSQIYTTTFKPFPSRPEIDRVLMLVPGCGLKKVQGISEPVHQYRSAATFVQSQNMDSQWFRALFKSQLPPILHKGPVTRFTEQVAHVAATILALSLFEAVETLLVRPDPMVWRRGEVKPSTVISAICRVFGGEKACCDVEEWHRICRILAGDDGSREKDEEIKPPVENDGTIVSCVGGQAVMSLIPFQKDLPGDDESFLKLNWRRGNMFHKHSLRRCHKLTGSDSYSLQVRASMDAFEVPPGLTASHLSPDQHWAMVVRETPRQGILECAMVYHADEGEGGNLRRWINRGGMLRTLASTERIEACMHPPSSSVDIPAHAEQVRGPKTISANTSSASSPLVVYPCGPGNPFPWFWECTKFINHELKGEGRAAVLKTVAKYSRRSSVDAHGYPGAIAVVSTYGDNNLRMFALSKPVGAHAALRHGACVECCLKFCKENEFEILVL